jgi:hypothetical protein
MSKSRSISLWLLAFSLFLCGCNLMVPFAFVGDPKKRVLPEFDKLPGKRVAILVWTDPATLFDYPYARIEIATYIADKLSYEMAQRKRGTQVVDPRDLEDFLQKNAAARVNPWEVGRHFNADYVIYIEVLEFQIRSPDEPQFLRGRVEAAVAVHDTGERSREADRFTLTPVRTVYPDNTPVMLTATNAPLVREATYRAFAEQVARKFYEYDVSL